MTTSASATFARHLTSILLSGYWSRLGLQARAWSACPDDRGLVKVVVDKLWERFGARRPSRQVLAEFLKAAIAAEPHPPEVRRIDLRGKRMKPRWPVPKFATAGKIAKWLDISLGQLDWFADVKEWTLHQDQPKLRHYVTIRLPRRRGKSRLLEVPKLNLKAMQRRILDEILSAIPSHEAAHGFRVGRSIVSYTQPHVGRRIVLRFDLRDFFASVSSARVQAIFHTAGYPLPVARLLTGLCTTRTPDEVAAEPAWRQRHLPQGAPTSPALANLAAYRLDVRLHALAQKLDASYSRYADDIAFSGEERLERAAKRVQVLVAVIAAEEGFALHFQKSRFMRQGVRQQLAGVVVNARPNVGRDAYDLLKAILHNCVRSGPASQNRAGHADFCRHLQGRIAHVRMLNPARAAKLQAIFDRIVWPS